MDDELKPCPFCGGMAIIFPLDKTEGLRIMHEFKQPYYRAYCQNKCGCIMGDFTTRMEAVKRWNGRV